MNARTWVAVGAFSGAITVALGAFGAHALKDSVPAAELDIWGTAVQYQGLHALALILFGLFAERRQVGNLAGWSFLVGSAIFAGTLYAMVLGGPRWLGAITPLGGIAMILGWITFGLVALRKRHGDSRP